MKAKEEIKELLPRKKERGDARRFLIDTSSSSIASRSISTSVEGEREAKSCDQGRGR